MKIFLRLILLVTPFLVQANQVSQETFDLVQRANRKTNAKNMRVTTVNNQATKSLLAQPTNGDQERYADKRASYGKALRQLETGLVDPTAYDALVRATQTRTPADFNAIAMGTNPVERRLVSPQAGISLNMLGGDSGSYSMSPAPELTSAQRAGEMVELYWMSLLKDINFTAYQNGDEGIEAALADLNNLTDFRGPKVDGLVTPQTLFRENCPGCIEGPLVSQFFYKNVPYSDTYFVQQYTLPLPTNPPDTINDFMTARDPFLAIQQGANPTAQITFDPTRRYIRNIRDIANFVHGDPAQWPYFCTLLILLNFGPDALDQSNPYFGNPTQEAFADFGVPQFASMISECGELALRAAWFQKWFVHRVLRPEYCAFLISEQINGILDSNINEQVINSEAIQNIAMYNNQLNGTVGDNVYFLPQSYPEGSPTHPSYPAGHATLAGACTTILKAICNEDFIVPEPVVSNADGTALDPIDDQLTLGGELNKFGANIATARNMAGVHYRSDGTEGMLLGEQVALAFLQDWAYNNHIPFQGFSLTKFDGTRVTVGATQVAETI